MKFGIIGTSRITYDHIKVIKVLGHDILFISSTRKKSKKLEALSKKHKIKKIFFNWKEAIKFSKNVKNFNFLITSRINDNFKVLKECIKTNSFIFIEKPVFLKSKDFIKFQKNKKIFVGYNRIFYNNIKKLKKKIWKKKNLNIIVKCPEDNYQNIIKNSCHIFSILKFLFGDLRLILSQKNKNYINCFLKNENNCSFYLSFNMKNTDNFSVEIFDKKKRYVLSPIEYLKVFDKIKIKKITNNYTYSPQTSLTMNEFKENKFKPGFKSQIEEFAEFTRGKKIVNNINFSKKIVQLCEKILK